MTVASTAVVTADARGYSAQSGPGAGGSTAYMTGGGGGYGGNGGRGGRGDGGYINPLAPGGVSYGSITQPLDLGSGDGGGSYAGRGGGAIRLIVAGTLTVDGELTADGAAATCCSGYGNGGGSGGSVYITAGTVAGVGVISANGGAGYNDLGHDFDYGGGGAGGRIAIYYDADTFSGTMAARGAWGYGRGGAGTIFTKSSSQAGGDLLLENGGSPDAATPLLGVPVLDSLTLTSLGHASLAEEWTIGQLSISGDTNFTIGASLTVTDALIVASSTLAAGAGDLTVTGDLTLQDTGT